jgi:lipoyl synthase
MIKCSAGTAKVLGLKELKTDALPTTAYLMTGEHCSNDCSFCPQARNASSRADMLARITWPAYDQEQVIDRIATAHESKQLQRACFQVVNSQDALAETKVFLEKVHSRSKVPVCVSCAVGTLEAVGELLAQGADHVSIALDAACEKVFSEHKGGSWSQKHSLLGEAAKAYPGRIATHLIVGLGETEEEMLTTIQEMTNLGVIIALFAFTPVRGTRLEKHNPPALGHYRRIQAGRYLMLKGITRVEQMNFVAGRLMNFGLERAKWEKELADGEAFRTSGCPDCNRPYYNEKPGGTIYNYPVPLTEEQRQLALRELDIQ